MMKQAGQGKAIPATPGLTTEEIPPTLEGKSSQVVVNGDTAVIQDEKEKLVNQQSIAPTPGSLDNNGATIASVLGTNVNDDPTLGEPLQTGLIDIGSATVRDIFEVKPLHIWPTTYSVGEEGSHEVPSTSTGYEVPSKEMCAEITVATSSEAEGGVDIYDKAYVRKNAFGQITEIISRLVTGAVFTVLTNLGYPAATDTASIAHFQNNQIGNLFGNRRIVESDGAKNGHVLIAAQTMDPTPRQEFMGTLVVNPQQEMRLGVYQKLTAGGVRNVRIRTHEIIKSAQVYLATTFASVAFRTTRLANYFTPLITSIRCERSSVQLSRQEAAQGPLLTQDPYVSASGIRMQQLLLNSSPSHQVEAQKLAKLLTSKSGVTVNKNRIINARSQLNGKGDVGSRLAAIIREVPEDLMAQLFHAEVAPHLYKFGDTGYQFPLNSGPETITTMFDILALYVMMPVIAHKMDHLLIPYIMSTIRGLDFGRRYTAVSNYSNNSTSPEVVDPARFYSPNGYPNILKPGHAVPPGAMTLLRNILYYHGAPINLDRAWDPQAKALNSGYAYMAPTAGLQALGNRIRTLGSYFEAIVADPSASTWTRSTTQSLSSVISSIESMTSGLPRAWHYSGGYLAKALASSPAVNAPLQTLFGEMGHHYFPATIIRNGVESPGRQLQLEIPRGLGSSLLFAGWSSHFNEMSVLTSTIAYTSEEVLDVFKRMLALLVEGTRAGIAAMATNVIAEYVSESVETVAPLRRGNRDWVSPIMRGLSEGAPVVLRPSAASFDAITNPVFVNQLNASRPMPPVVCSYVMQLVDEVFPSHWVDFLTTTTGDHSGTFFRQRPSYMIRYDVATQYISPRVTFCEQEFTNAFAYFVSRALDTSEPEMGYLRGLILAWTNENTVVRFADDRPATSFDWDQFIANSTYTDAGGTVHNYQDVWLVRSLDDDITNVPAKYTHFGIIALGGVRNLTQVITLANSSEVTLYICTRANYGPVAANWLPWDNARTILTTSSSAVLKSGGESINKVQVLQQLLSRGASQNEEPGALVFHDPYTLFRAQPEDVMANSNTLKDEGSVANGYFGTAYIADMPPLFSDMYSRRSTTIAGGPGVNVFMRFISSDAVRERIIGIRPSLNDSDIAGQNIYNYNNYHQVLKADPYYAQLNGGAPLDGIATSNLVVANRTQLFCHAIDFFNPDTLRTIKSGPLYNATYLTGE